MAEPALSASIRSASRLTHDSASAPSRLVAVMTPRDLRKRRVVGESFAEPVVPHACPSRPQLVGPFQGNDVAPGDVEESRGPECGVHRMQQQLVDLPGALVRICIRKERADLLRRGQCADDVERDSSEELGIRRRTRGLDAERKAWRSPRGRSRRIPGHPERLRPVPWAPRRAPRQVVRCMRPRQPYRPVADRVSRHLPRPRPRHHRERAGRKRRSRRFQSRPQIAPGLQDARSHRVDSDSSRPGGSRCLLRPPGWGRASPRRRSSRE